MSMEASSFMLLTMFLMQNTFSSSVFVYMSMIVFDYCMHACKCIIIASRKISRVAIFEDLGLCVFIFEDRARSTVFTRIFLE